MQKTLLKTLLLGAATLSLAACGNLSKIDADGRTDNPIFPKAANAKHAADAQYKGKWVQKEDVAMIKAGMDKQQVSDILGYPHFNEGLFDVREWDYVLNYRENGEVRTCQYKITFNSNMIVAQQYWKPEDCSLRSDISTAVVTPATPVHEHKAMHKKVYKKKNKAMKKSAPSKALEVISKSPAKKA